MNSIAAIQRATDNELLMQFVRTADESCFEELVARHGSMVLGVCRTVLHRLPDAEDAFQATFLVLIRKAKCLLTVNSLAAWLYKVAYRISVRSSQNRNRKATAELDVDPPSKFDQFHQISQQEILSEVFAELAQMPAKYKDVLVECYLEGRSYREVANATDSNETVIKGRVAQAKRVLRRRLLKRGIALTIVLGILDQVRTSAIGSSLLESTLASSVAVATQGQAAKLTNSIQNLTSYGAQSMGISFSGKTTALAATIGMVAIGFFCIQTFPVDAQESGSTLEIQSAPETTESTRITLEQGTIVSQNPIVSVEPVAPADDPATEAAAKAESKIMGALGQKSDFQFDATPLNEVVGELAKIHDIPIYLDRQAIEDAGFDDKLPMTGMGQGRTLKSALKFLFMDYDFTFVIKDETLMITTVDAISNNPERYLLTKLYVINQFKKEPSRIIEVLQNNVSPQSWLDTNGGPGTIDSIETGSQTVLIVGQTLENHMQIDSILQQLNKLAATDQD